MSRAPRNGSIEYARFIGALAIVWFHMALPGSTLALGALQLFLIIQIYFSWGRPLRVQIQRIMVPWVFWSVFYGSAKVAKAVLTGNPVGDVFESWMLLTGPALHLWYLPFSILAIVVAKGVSRLASWNAIYVFGICLAGLCLYWANTTDLPIPFKQWITVIPAAVVAVLCRSPLGEKRVLSFAIAACAVMVAGFGMTGVALQTLVAVSGLLIAITFVVPSSALSDTLGGVSFGIYLVHPFIYSAALSVMQPGEISTFVVVALASILLTLVFRRFAPATV